MQSESFDYRIRAILSLALNVEVPPMGDFIRADNPAWDSLKQVELIFMLEDEFGIQFSEEEFALLDSVASIAKLVEAHLAS